MKNASLVFLLFISISIFAQENSKSLTLKSEVAKDDSLRFRTINILSETNSLTFFNGSENITITQKIEVDSIAVLKEDMTVDFILMDTTVTDVEKPAYKSTKFKGEFMFADTLRDPDSPTTVLFVDTVVVESMEVYRDKVVELNQENINKITKQIQGLCLKQNLVYNKVTYFGATNDGLVSIHPERYLTKDLDNIRFVVLSYQINKKGALVTLNYPVLFVNQKNK